MHQGEIPLIKYCTEEYLQRGRIIFYNQLLKYEVFCTLAGFQMLTHNIVQNKYAVKKRENLVINFKKCFIWDN